MIALHYHSLSKAEREYLRSSTDCEICAKPAGRLQIDHDHETGLVRGVVCGGCNHRLGYLDIGRPIGERTWRKAASAYINRNRERWPVWLRRGYESDLKFYGPKGRTHRVQAESRTLQERRKADQERVGEILQSRKTSPYWREISLHWKAAITGGRVAWYQTEDGNGQGVLS